MKEGKVISPQDLEKEVKVWYHSRRRKRLKWNINNDEDTGVTAYTDGSKINCKVGAAVAVLLDGKVFHRNGARLEDHFTMFQAEAWAMLLGVRWIKEYKIWSAKLKVIVQRQSKHCVIPITPMTL